MIISKKQLIGVVAIGILLAGVVFFIWWVSKGRFIQTTDDAYIGGNITTVASKVSGYISAIEVRDNQSVKKGDIIMIIESMKLMNEVQSEFDGIVDKILVSDGQAVEYDQPIMIIK